MKKIIVIVWFSLVSTCGFSQGEKLKSTYLYQFAKILQWPNLKASFTIGVWSGDEITPLLQKIATLKKVGTRDLIIKQISRISEVDGCQIIFLSAKAKGNIRAVVEASKGKNVLIVGESPDMIEKGVGINFLIIKERVLYDVSKPNLAAGGLSSAALIEKLAHKVY